MKHAIKKIVLQLFDAGVIKFGKFLFKHHEEFPEAPPAPMKIDLRTADHPKGGPLTKELVKLIAAELYTLALALGIKYDCVTGIPNAGEPFAEEFAKHCGKPLIKMVKKEESGRRWIAGVKGNIKGRGQKILVLDDLITFGNSKREAVEVLENAGFVIAALLFVVDREEGGLQAFREMGYNVQVLFSLIELLDFLLSENKITPEQYQKNIGYLEAAILAHK
jgi:uridine monophosphate synthetase